MARGDRAAHLTLARLVTGLLARWRAYDFRDDWADLVQEVLLAVIRAEREGRVEQPAAWVGYVRATTHHKLMDRLRAPPMEDRSQRRTPDGAARPCRRGARQRSSGRGAPARSSERTRRVVAVYGQQRT
jgi:DNA-directed RNA polymerase specialized sigma24 family protein